MNVKFSYNIALSLLLTVLGIGTLVPQAVVPVLNLTEYDSNLMNQVYGQSYFLNSLNSWSDQVNNYKGVIRANWEAAADQAISDYVGTITTTDSYNTVAEYRDYVNIALRSQERQAINTWEDRANLDMLRNKEQFIARLHSGRVDELYLNRLGAQDSLQPNEQNPANQALSDRIAHARNQWEAGYEDRYDQGNYDFTTSASQISDNYNSMLAALDASNLSFQQNLLDIDRYKTYVKNAISGMLTGFATDLAADCSKAEGCAYRYGNNQMNGAGRLLTGMVTRIRAELNKTTVDTSFSLTSLATEINGFLTNQRTIANGNYTNYFRDIITNQTNVDGITGGASIYSNDINELRSNLVNGNFNQWIGTNGGGADEWWKQSNDPNDPFQGIVGTRHSILNAIHSGRMGDLTNVINWVLGNGGPRTVVVGSITANILTADGSLRNKHEAGDILAYTGVSHAGFQCHWPQPCDPSQAFRGNFATERAAYSTYRIHRGTWSATYQMDRVAYGVVYQMHNADKADYASYWSGITASLGNQVGQYELNITPAIFAWESQVKSYNDFYTNWKVEASVSRTQAKLDYDTAMVSLEAKKQAWNAKIEDEYRSGSAKWENLAARAETASSDQEFARIQRSAQRSLQTLQNSNTDTGAGSVLASYTAASNALTSREFTFTDTTGVYTPVTNIGFIDTVKSGIGGMYDDLKMVAKDISKIFTSESSMIAGLAGEMGVSIKQKLVTSIKSYSIFGASEERTLDKSLSVGGKDISEVFRNTVNGVYQYAQILSVNENNDNAAVAQQTTLINQMTYGIEWKNRVVARYNEKGEFENNGDVDLKGILKELTNTKGYASHMANCAAMQPPPTEGCFAKVHGESLKKLKEAKLDYQDGMIVTALTHKERFRLGQLDAAEMAALSQADKAKVGSCYVNPAGCADLLRKDFDSNFDTKSKVVTLTKTINNGRVVGRDAKGEYIAGSELVSRSVALSSVKPVLAPKGKDLFDVWGKDDWTDFSNQAEAAMTGFYNTSYAKDSRRIENAVASIRAVESSNVNKFQAEKSAREAQDSLVKDMLIAYFTGGMAGVKGAIKSKIEDQINTGMATAFARATGADDDQIAALSQAMSFMRGRLKEQKIKREMGQGSHGNFINSQVNMIKDPKNLIKHTKIMVKSAVKVIGKELARSMALAEKVASVMMPGMNELRNGLIKSVIGDKAYDANMRKITVQKDQLAEIQSERESMVQSNVTQAVALSTGLPAEVVGNMLTDYRGSQAAKKVRRSINSNPIANIGSQIKGAVGGIMKTAIVALGVPERDIQKAMAEQNRMAYSDIVDKNMETQSLAYSNQMMGMKAPGTSYTSATPTLKDKKGLVKELGQRMVVDRLSVGMTKGEKEVLNTAFRGAYGKRETRKADKKAKNEAVRSTAITVITTVATLGAAGALGPAFQSSMGLLTGSAKLTAAVIKTAVQIADGSRNGIKGMIAGAANGAISMITQGASQGVPIADFIREGASKAGLGIGITYDRQNGWGGSLGVGGSKANISVSFSEHGNTSINGSLDLERNTGIRGLQLTGGTTTNGATTIGANYNFDNRGPRDGLNLTTNYDINGGGLSGGASYAAPNSRMALSVNVDRNGLASSTQYNGVNMGTNTANGFQANEFNWAQENINASQNVADEHARAVFLESQSFHSEIALRLRDINNNMADPSMREEAMGNLLADLEHSGFSVESAPDGQINLVHRDAPFLGFGGSERVVELNAHGNIQNTLSQDGMGFFTRLGGGDTTTIINGTQVRDGNGIFRNPNGELQVLSTPSSMREVLNAPGRRFILTQSGMDNVGLEGVRMNDLIRAAAREDFGDSYGGSLHVHNDTRTAIGDAINYLVSGTSALTGYRGVEPADATWDAILTTDAVNGSTIVAHSQGAHIVTNAFDRANANLIFRSDDPNRPILFLVGGAHVRVPSERGVNVIDLRNANDPIPSLSRPTGRILNFNENMVDRNYRLIRQENPTPSRVSNDGYVLWESNPLPPPIRPYKWGNENTTGHAITNYLPGIEYVLHPPKDPK